MPALSQKRRSRLCISVNTRRVFEESGIKQYIFPGSEVNVFHAFRFGVQKLLSNSGIRNEKVYLVSTLCYGCFVQVRTLWRLTEKSAKSH